MNNSRLAEFLKTTPDAGLHLKQVATTLSLQDLSRVSEAPVNLAVRPRTLAPELSESAAKFGETLQENLALDLSEFDFASGRLAPALREVFASVIRPQLESDPGPGLSLFARDVAELAEKFARIARDSRGSAAVHPGDSGADRKLRLRIDRVEDDMCAAFHTDCYRMRMICTYRGAGTEWTANENVDRREFYSLPASDRLIDSQRVFRLRAGWVAILKGEGYPGAEGAAIVHRSPAASPEEWRLVLRIDCD
ncbi:MAG: DUF1826 domain-containing protein [Leptospirales bacterium]